MAKYVVVLSKRAAKQLDKLTDTVAKPILLAINNLSNDPLPTGNKKLKGRNGYRIRIGDYRVIYEFYERELIVDVINLGHRKNVYD